MIQPEPAVIILGSAAQCGAYILRIALHKPLSLTFGRFRGGEPFALSPGVYLYVGSAMAEKGAASLARRLVRHATRSGDQPAHPIRADMIARFRAEGLGSGELRLRQGKSLFWHVDYLLDLPAVTLTHVLVVRAKIRLEGALAELIQSQPNTTLPAVGLGASDVPHGTHLFRVKPVAGWWRQLQTDVRNML